MKTWSDAVVTFAAHVSNYFGPVTKMIDAVAEHVISPQVAHACSNTYLCNTQCGYGYCGGTFDFTIYNYAGTISDCINKRYCSSPQYCGC